MNTHSFQSAIQGHTHHFARFTMSDDSVVEGFMQPNDGNYAYLTKADGSNGGKVKIDDVKSVEFPND